MSDLEWLNFCIDEARSFGHADKAAALERIRARLTPDLERVARAMYEAIWHHPSWEHAEQHDWLVCADAAIAAMGETP